MPDERSSRASTAWPRAIAGAQEHAFIVLDPQGCVTDWAGDAAAIYGYPAEEMLGKTLERLLPAEERDGNGLGWALHTVRVDGYLEEDRWNVRKDGVRIYACSVTTALRDEAGSVTGFLRIVRDRTDLAGQIESLERRLAHWQKGEDRRFAMLATLAHEIRNPLAAIALAGRVIASLPAGDERSRDPLHAIERQTRYIDGLVQDLLETARAAAGKARLHCETLELRKLVADAVEMCEGALHARGQVLEMMVPPGVQVEVDAVRMRQVIVNLLSNASKFSPFGSRVWVKASVDSGELVLRVEDLGRGIAPDLLPTIFELFTQTGAEGEAAGQGLGLGLSVVKSLVEMHGGTVQARSEGRGLGTKVIVRMPARQPTAAAA